MVNGLIIIWMVWAYIPGKMEDVTGVNIKTTKSMAMGSIYGVMVDNTQATGSKVSSTVLESTTQ